MAYEINISKNGIHYFATAERSIGSGENKKLKDIYDKLKSIFPESEGYKFIVTKYENIGNSVDIEKL